VKALILEICEVVLSLILTACINATFQRPGELLESFGLSLFGEHLECSEWTGTCRLRSPDARQLLLDQH
jgi:hypothetical protein